MLTVHAVKSTSPAKIARGRKIIPGKRIITVKKEGNGSCCACGKNAGNNRWIQCDKCDGWYHLKCTGFKDSLNDLDIEKLDFLCNHCKSTNI